MTGIDLIAAPFGDGAGVGGAEMGPAALRAAGLRGALTALGRDVETRTLAAEPAEDWTPPAAGRVKNAAAVAGWARAVARACAESFAAGRIPALLGGDHALSMGSVPAAAAHWAAQGRPLLALWLDAHADFNTPETSPSGNMHGMALAMACGEAGFDGLLGAAPGARLPADRAHLIGLRDTDPDERRLLRSRGVQVIDMRRIDEFGVVACLRELLMAAADADAALHVSFDLDTLDPAAAPGVGAPAPGGLTYREVRLILELLHDSGRVGSVDLMELNPMRDDRGRTAAAAVDLAASLFGRPVDMAV